MRSPRFAAPARPAPAVAGLLCSGTSHADQTTGASPAGVAQHGGGKAGAGPAAAERSTQRLRPPLAPGPGCLSGAASVVRDMPGRGARGGGDGGRPRGAASRRPAAVLGREQLGAGLQALSRWEDRARGPLGLSPRPGGEVSSIEGRRQGPVGPSSVCGREIREGGIRASSGGLPGFLPSKASRFDALL